MRQTLSLFVAVLAAVAWPALGQKVLQLPIRTDGPKSLDPVEGSTTYDNMACVQFYETLLETCYYDTTQFEPRLLADHPERLDDGKRWRFTLKEGVRFHDDPCFPGGRGREVTSEDVFYSWKRLADPANGLENWWLLDGVIEGLAPPVKDARGNSPPFDYSAPVAGLVKIDDRTFEVALTKPVFRFLWVLTMFQTSIVPREAVEHYGEDFAAHPVGTGPFLLEQWVPKSHMHVRKNPGYHDVRYPAAELWSSEDREIGLDRAAGERVPFVDRIEFSFYVEDQPMWLEFRQGKLGYVELPYTVYSEAFAPRSKRLTRELRSEGVTFRSTLLLDMIFRAFNMEDPVWGGYTEEKRALRRAISLAIDFGEINEDFYEGVCIQYDGPIPPGLDGHPEGGRVAGAPRGPDIPAALAALAEAGHPNGEGLPPLRFYTSHGSNNPQQAETLRRQLAAIGITLDPQLVDFSQLIELTNKKQAPFFGFAWSSDYPDSENNLALFYSPNESPGSNHWNYKNPEYDALYEQIVTMEPGPERTALYERMRDMVIRDVPMVGSLARERFYLIAPWLRNARPTERYSAWFKFLDVDDSRR